MSKFGGEMCGTTGKCEIIGISVHNSGIHLVSIVSDNIHFSSPSSAADLISYW